MRLKWRIRPNSLPRTPKIFVESPSISTTILPTNPLPPPSVFFCFLFTNYVSPRFVSPSLFPKLISSFVQYPSLSPLFPHNPKLPAPFPHELIHQRTDPPLTRTNRYKRSTYGKTSLPPLPPSYLLIPYLLIQSTPRELETWTLSIRHGNITKLPDLNITSSTRRAKLLFSA